MVVSWTSPDAEYVSVKDLSSPRGWGYNNIYPKNGSFMTGVKSGDVWTFTAVRGSDGAKVSKTVTVL
jgi:hypothetical protein